VSAGYRTENLLFASPLMNAAGILGFAPDPKNPVDLSGFGAFVTPPLSRGPRSPANLSRFAPYPGGVLLHSGLPNPGLSAVIRQYARRWNRSPLPIIAHLLALSPASLQWMIEQLENLPGVMAVEIGLPPEIDPAAAQAFAQAAVGELPAIVRLPLEQAAELSPLVIDAGVSAVSLGAPRGTISGMTGRMYGPALFPLALHTVEKLAAAGIPVIGAGGIYHRRDMEAMLNAGARAVQIDTVLWRGGL